MAKRGSIGPIAFIYERLIIGEGPHDAAFFRELVSDPGRAIPQFHVHCAEDLSDMPGKSRFSESLARIRNLSGFSNLTSIVLAVDSDTNARSSFDEVATMVRNVRAPEPHEPPVMYPVPTVQNRKVAGSPSITIMMIPGKGKVGALETLCFEAASRNIPASATCVAQFARCARTELALENWTER
jgi:hypothetical protein